ncbi:MAG: ribokinase [Clostridia bacterium]|nr:ribokinase [Clostridia bacterium]
MKKHYDTLEIGHISLDYNIDYLDHQIIEVGGAVIYSSAAAYAGGYKVGVVTKVAPEDKDRLDCFVIDKQDVFYIPSKESTSIRNKYHTADKERRTCTCIGQGDSFTIDDIPDVDVDVYHFAGLIYGDFDGDLMIELSKRGKIAVDVQALLRHANRATGEMYFEDWADKKRILPYIDYLKTDTAEAEILTGQTDRVVAAKMLHEWGAKEVVITNSAEVLAFDGKEMYTCPIKARNLSGRSGRGDTTFAAYITQRQSSSMAQSLLWATATVSTKMEAPGPYKGKREDIEAYIKEFYPDKDLKKINF